MNGHSPTGGTGQSLRPLGHVWQLPISGRIVAIDPSASISFEIFIRLAAQFYLCVQFAGQKWQESSGWWADGRLDSSGRNSIKIDWINLRPLSFYSDEHSSGGKECFLSVNYVIRQVVTDDLVLAEENWTGRKVWEIVAFPCHRKRTKSRDFGVCFLCGENFDETFQVEFCFSNCARL